MKAVAYYRFSSDNQRQESITAQRRAVEEYASRNDITIIKEYIDEALTATTDDRPQFLQMISDITNELYAVELLLVHKLDRFARNRTDSAIYKQKLTAKGIKLLAVDQPLGDSPEDALLEGLLESMNEFYSRNLGREVEKGMRETALQAKHTGGKPPLGFDVSPDKKLILNPAEAQIVKSIFEMAASGEGYGGIVKKLNASGAKTKNGKPFGKNSIHEILKNEKYTGTYVFNRTTRKHLGKRNNHKSKTDDKIIKIPGAIPEIIPFEQWQQIQETLKSRKHLAPRVNDKAVYILTGKLFCGKCGGAYTGFGTVAGRNKTYYRLYRCVNKRQNKTCDNKDVRKEVIENYVLDHIEKTFNEKNINKLMNKINEYQQKRANDYTQEISQIENKISGIKTQINNLIMAIAEGHLKGSIAGPKLDVLTRDKERLELRLNEIAKKTVDYSKEEVLKYIKLIQQILKERDNPMMCKKVVDICIEKIILNPDDFKIIDVIKSDAFSSGGGGGSLTLEASEKRSNIVKYNQRI
jgi:site-specific DNA recombinase